MVVAGGAGGCIALTYSFHCSYFHIYLLGRYRYGYIDKNFILGCGLRCGGGGGGGRGVKLRPHGLLLHSTLKISKSPLSVLSR